MGKRWVMGLVAMVGVIALSGIGFAAFTAQATINGTATAGTFGPLVWGGNPLNTPTVSDQSTCQAGTASGSAWTGLVGKNFTPGDGCLFHDALTLKGNLPGKLTESAMFSDTVAACGLANWAYNDTLIGTLTFSAANGTSTTWNGGSLSITPGTTIAFYGSFHLLAGAPNACQGDVLTVGTITITGTAT